MDLSITSNVLNFMFPRQSLDVEKCRVFISKLPVPLLIEKQEGIKYEAEAWNKHSHPFFSVPCHLEETIVFLFCDFKMSAIPAI